MLAEAGVEKEEGGVPGTVGAGMEADETGAAGDEAPTLCCADWFVSKNFLCDVATCFHSFLAFAARRGDPPSVDAFTVHRLPRTSPSKAPPSAEYLMKSCAVTENVTNASGGL